MNLISVIVARYGLGFVFLNVFLSQAGAPVPAEPTLIVVGTLARDGMFAWPLVIALTVVASVLGNGIWYTAGWYYGKPVLRVLCRLSLSADSCVRQTESIFERWGVNSLMAAKFVPGIGLVAPALAGAMRMTVSRFLFYTAVGAAAWALVMVGVGWIFRTQVGWLIEHIIAMGSAALPIIGVALVLFVVFKWWKRWRFRNALRMARVSVGELNAMMERGEEPVVLDARSETAYELDRRRIPTARAVNMTSPAEALVGIDPNRDIIVYCTCPNEASAARVARLLMNQGYHKVHPLAGGLDAWVAAGFSVVP